MVARSACWRRIDVAEWRSTALKSHIESGAPDAWKAGIRVLELAFTRSDSIEEFRFPGDLAEIETMSWKQMTFLAATLMEESVDEESAVVAVVEANGSQQ
jgi:hypothetical protein